MSELQLHHIFWQMWIFSSRWRHESSFLHTSTAWWWGQPILIVKMTITCRQGKRLISTHVYFSSKLLWPYSSFTIAKEEVRWLCECKVHILRMTGLMAGLQTLLMSKSECYLKLTNVILHIIVGATVGKDNCLISPNKNNTGHVFSQSVYNRNGSSVVLPFPGRLLV